nr:hypothetical protein [Tanacetum cinerariifolium]
MSRDVITVGSTMRIPLLYRGEYSQWRERFMNYLEEQTDGEAMINSIQNDPKFWTAEEKKTRKIDRLTRSLLIQGLPNDIYSLIDSNKTAKDLWDALERQMRGSEYGEQDRKAVILYEYETFKAIEGEQLLDTYLRLLKKPLLGKSPKQNFENQNKDLQEKYDVLINQINFEDDYFQEIINPDFKKIDSPFQQTSSLKPYVPNVILEKILTDLKDEVVNLLEKEKANLETIESLKSKSFESRENAISESKNQRENDCFEVEKECDKVENLKVIAPRMFKLSVSQSVSPMSISKTSCEYNNVENTFSNVRRPKHSGVIWKKKGSSNTPNKDSDEQVLLAEDQAWMKSSSDSDQEINANMVFMAQIEKVLSESNESSSSAEETIAEQNQGDVNDALGDKKKAIVVHSDPLALVCEKTNVSNQKEKVVVSSDFEGSSADDFSELKKITALLAKAFNRRKFYSKPTNNNLRTSSTSQSANKKQEFVKTNDKKVERKLIRRRGHILMKLWKLKSLKDLEKIKLNFEKIDSPFQQTSSLKPYISNEILEKIIIDLEDEVVSLLEKEKENLKKIESLKSNGFGSIENAIFESENQSENGCLEVEKECDKVENLKDLKIQDILKKQDLRPMLYDEKVIGLGYTPMLLTHSNEALEIEKFKRSRENKIEFAYDYGNLNASYVNEKIKFSHDYFQEIINPDFEKIDSPFQQTSSLKPYISNEILEKIIIDLEDEVVSLLEKEKENLKKIESLKSNGFGSIENAIFESENQSENGCLEVEKECDKVENLKVISPGMFKLSVSQSVSPISMTKTLCDSFNVE